MEGFTRAADRLSTALAVCAAAMVLLAVLIVTYMIVARLLGASNYWEVELSIFLSVAAIFLASPYCLRTKGHVAVDLLGHILPAGTRRALRIFLGLIGLAVCIYLTVMGAEKFWEVFHTGERSNSLWKPYMWPLYLSVPVGLGLTAVQYVVELIAPDRPQPDIEQAPL